MIPPTDELWIAVANIKPDVTLELLNEAVFSIENRMREEVIAVLIGSLKMANKRVFRQQQNKGP